MNRASQATANPTTLNYTGVNWAVAQTVTVNAVGDAAQEGVHGITLSHTASDPGFDCLAIADITDDDTMAGQVLVTHFGGKPDVAESGAETTTL